ncbi:MAG: GTP-binding protein [Candidatus Tectimicrobiota bacterium]
MAVGGQRPGAAGRLWRDNMVATTAETPVCLPFQCMLSVVFWAAGRRPKGFIKVPGSRQWHEVQWVPGALEVRLYPAPKRLPAHLVVLGRRIPWEHFLAALEQCLEAAPPRARRRQPSALS